MSSDNFLSKSNIYPTIWAIIVVLLGFIGGLFWKSITGPDEVVVLNRDNSKDTTVTIIQFKPDQEYFENLNKMTAKTVKKQYANNQQKEKKENIDSLTMNIAKEYQLKFDSLMFALSESSDKELYNEIISVPPNKSIANNSKIKRPKFKMPQIVSGYVQSKMNSFATISLNSKVINKKDKIIATIEFFNKSTLDKITPIFIDLVEPKSKNSVYQIWGEQYEINELKNIISFSADFKPGNYILTIGFYQLDKLNTKYPTFYSRKYNIEIK